MSAVKNQLELRGAAGESPAPPVIEDAPPREIIDSKIRDVYFAYDSSDLLPDARSVLAGDAVILKSMLAESPRVVLAVEGHCDERGSAEYNLALGDMRARSARDFLVEFGVAAGQLDVISYGKERPQCSAAEESCWSRNRRAHIAAK